MIISWDLCALSLSKGADECDLSFSSGLRSPTTAGHAEAGVSSNPGQLVARTLAGPYRSSWTDLGPAGHRIGSQPPRLDLALANGQRFGSQPWISLR